MKHLPALATALLVGLLAPERTFCQEPGGPIGEMTAQAEAFAARGLELFRAGKFEEAADEFMKAYRVSGRPSPLRNAAKALEQAELLDRSLSLWMQYASQPVISSEEKAEAEAHVALIHEKRKEKEMERQVVEAKAEAAAARELAEARREEPQTPPVERLIAEPAEPSLGPPIVIAAGGATAVAGVVFLIASAAQLADVDARLEDRDAEGKIKGIGPVALADEVSSVNAKRTVAGVSLVLGSVVATAGLAWLLSL